MILHPKALSEKIGFKRITEYLADQVRTKSGREQITDLQVSSETARVKKQLAVTGQMLRLINAGENIPFPELPDIRNNLKHCQAVDSLLQPKAILEILKTAKTSRRLKGFIKQRQNDFEINELAAISANLQPLRNVEHAIDEILDEYGEVKDDASSRLRSLRKKVNRKKGAVRNTVQKVMQKAVSKGMASDDGITIRSGRMVIPVEAKYKRKIDGFVHDVSSTGQTVFLEPVEALNLNNEIRELEIEINNEIERLLRALTGTIRSHRDVLKENMENLAELDVILAKARLGHRLDGVVPAVSNNDTIVLWGARNPSLLLKNMTEEESENVVPLNLELEADERCLMITGPNAGGKSVALKTLALCGLMMQSGIPVPVDEQSRLPLFDSYFVDIGDDQSIESDLSTFSSRLQWIKHTLEKCGSKSLVLIDEAGSGTDPEEGGALYQAFIEKLISRRSRCVVTTHHGSLKVFADQNKAAVNGSMEFDAEHLNPTYRFKKGIPGSSYAFEIATRMQLDADMVARAKKLLGQPKRKLDHLITDLEAKYQQARQSQEKYARLKEDAEKLKKRYEGKLNNVQQKRDKLEEEALEKAEAIVEQANSRLENVIQEITERGQQLDKKDIKQARRSIDQQKKGIKKKLHKKQKAQPVQTTHEQPEVGDIVRLKDTTTSGELTKQDGNKAIILVNGLKLKSDYRKLVKVRSGKEGKKSQPAKRVKNYTTDYQPRERLSSSLMIRGMRAKEAIQRVEQYIDDAVAAGLHKVDIIHGKGQGILKSQVHNYLKQRKEVRDFYIAPVHQGGAGCTMVTLR